MKRLLALILCFVMCLSLLPAAASAEKESAKSNSVPVIEAQPKSVSVISGSTVIFSVSASGGSLTYQWQYRSGNSGEWKNSSAGSAKTTSLSVVAESYRSGYQYRCVIKNSDGSVISDAATLTVVTKPTISTQPKSQTIASGSTAKFSVKASGGSLSYQWQYRTSSSGTWANSSASGAKTKTLSISAETRRSGYQYRCRVKNAAGTTFSNAATLTVVTKPTISTQPKSVSTTAGKTAKFSVTATGGNLSYQWQYRAGSSGTWANSSASGAKTKTLSISAEARRNGYQYRCKVSNAAGTTYSSAATLTVTSSVIVYWVPSGYAYHSTKSCPSLARSKTILSGTIEEAIESGHDSPCKNCW